MSNGWFIGKLATAAGLSVSAVRYYERGGLLTPAQRTASGYRFYTLETVERLRFIQQAKALGFRLEEIKEILRLRDTGQSPCECVRDMLAQKLRNLEQEMARLQQFRRTLHKALERARKLPKLPHEASALCPIIQLAPLDKGKSRRRKLQ